MLNETAQTVRQHFASDLHRPQYHFLPPSNWMNDPNGFIQWQGKYHLFYQYNPFGPLWGNMHWGHTVSDDLVHWTDLPIALVPTAGSADEAGCFSGCAVNNGVPTFIYTGTRGEQCEIQTQCIATSDDSLLTWQKHPNNPVLSTVPPESGQTRDFRDPFVWKEGDAWYMVLGSRIKDVGGAVFLYKSADLLNWHYLHPLLVGDINQNGENWECPNFFKLGNQWLLIVSAQFTNATNTVLYFVGHYDNYQFTPIHEGVLDYGQLYAPLTTKDDLNRLLLMGWLRESRSSASQEQAGWSGVQSIPRVLSLDNKSRLVMTPIAELNAIRGKRHHYTAASIPDHGRLAIENQALDIMVEFTPHLEGQYGISLACSTDGQERLDIAYDAAHQCLIVRDIAPIANKTHTVGQTHLSLDGHFGFKETITDDHRLTVRTQSVPHELEADETLCLRILLDASVVEIIANDRTSLTYRIYPSSADRNQVRLLGSKSFIQTLDIWEMPSIWQSSQS